jgi:hypothetical protein
MKIKVFIGFFMSLIILSQGLMAQEITSLSSKIEALKREKEQVILEEKEALKKDVLAINSRYNNGEITEAEAENLKEEAAEIRAKNIENKIAIIDNQIALLERKGIHIKTDDTEVSISTFPWLSVHVMDDTGSLVDISFGSQHKYDLRTRSNLLIAFGLNNAIIEDQSLDDSPYKIGKSRFFEMGWVWTTRVMQNSNAVRFRYGFSFQFNGLSPIDNQYFVKDGDLTTIEEFDGKVRKAKLRMDNLVFPIHFEFGPSTKIDRGNYFRYSTRKKFKFGIGSYFGFNMNTRQKFKYTVEGSKHKDKLKNSYNTNNFIYGLSSYIGVDDFSFYVKYDLNEIFNEPNINQNNISFGMRFDL